MAAWTLRWPGTGPFSGGEIHRLGLLRAWLRDKPVEVLDEPTAFLDAAAAERVRTVIHERAQERLVLVSSDPCCWPRPIR